jgi:hypothetical protein
MPSFCNISTSCFWLAASVVGHVREGGVYNMVFWLMIVLGTLKYISMW